MNQKAKYYIDKLKLSPHPEGGYYNEIYRSGEFITLKGLPKRYKSKRAVSSLIYFLIEGKQISKFHKLQSDEVWHFYDGFPVKIYILNEAGELEIQVLGKEISKGESFQFTIKRNNWFAAELSLKNSFALIGCSVSPGFEFDDFRIAERKKLIEVYPQFEKEIRKFT